MGPTKGRSVKILERLIQYECVSSTDAQDDPCDLANADVFTKSSNMA